MSYKRLCLGSATMIVAHVVLSNLGTAIGLDLASHVALQAIFISLVSALAGGVVARKGFVPVALGVWLVLWIAIVYILYQIAAPAGHASVTSIARYNWVAVVLSGAATVIGAYLGQVLAATRASRAAAT